MDRARATGRPWRSWAAIAFVLLALALIQACDSGKHTGPTSNSSLQLKLHRVGGAEIPTGCTGVYSVSGPGVSITNAGLPASGQISFQGQVGQTYIVTVTLNCNGTILTGSAEVTLQPGPNSAIIQLTVSKVLGVSCSPNPVDPGKDSICTCSVQSPGVPSFGWTGATPTTGNQAKFNNNTPGSYIVTCSINGVAAGSTTVTVAANTINVTVNNTGSCCDIVVRFLGQVGTTGISAGQTKTFTVTPPAHFQADCGFLQNPFQSPLDDETLTSNTTLSLNFDSQCG